MFSLTSDKILSRFNARRHISSDWIEWNDDFFDGINLDVNFPVVPQEKLTFESSR